MYRLMLKILSNGQAFFRIKILSMKRMEKKIRSLLQVDVYSVSKKVGSIIFMMLIGGKFTDKIKK